MVRPYVMVVSCNIEITQEGARKEISTPKRQRRRYTHKEISTPERQGRRRAYKEIATSKGDSFEGRKKAKTLQSKLGKTKPHAHAPGFEPKTLAYEVASLSIRLRACAWRREGGGGTLLDHKNKENSTGSVRSRGPSAPQSGYPQAPRRPQQVPDGSKRLGKAQKLQEYFKGSKSSPTIPK